MTTELAAEFVANGALLARARAGLCALIEVLGFKDKTVILPANICPAVVIAVVAAGAKPQLVATDPDTGLMDDGAGADAIEASKDVGLIMPSHLYGFYRSYPQIMVAARAHGWFVLENDSHGALMSGHVPFGDAVLLSFGAGKVIDADGGGLLLAKDLNLVDAIKARIEQYDPHSFDHDQRQATYDLRRREAKMMIAGDKRNTLISVAQGEMLDVRTRYMGRLDGLNSALLGLEAKKSARFAVAEKWLTALGDIDGIEWPDVEWASPWRLIFTVPQRHRDAILAAVRQAGHDIGSNYPYVGDAFPEMFGGVVEGATEWQDRVINLWLTPEYEPSRIAAVSDIIKRVLNA